MKLKWKTTSTKGEKISHKNGITFKIQKLEYYFGYNTTIKNADDITTFFTDTFKEAEELITKWHTNILKIEEISINDYLNVMVKGII